MHPRPLLPRTHDTQAEEATPRQTEAVDSQQRRTLLPKGRPPAGPQARSHASTRTAVAAKRRPIASACEGCRRRKQRCDGTKPVCGPCARRGLECSNTVHNEQLMSTRTIRNQNADLKEENSKLWELYGFLFKLEDAEANEVFSRLRASGDPLAVLQAVKDSSLLFLNPDLYSHPTSSDPRLERLDLDALRASTFRVTARPWTVVAGDGLVSELISSFFAWDDAFFYPFIHRQAFIDDMRQNNPDTAQYCSPFLVNAICASRCLTSSRVKIVNSVSKRDLSTQFLNEAKKLLDLEEGQPSLPTAQGLALLFTLSAYRGTDRAGMAYRYACYDMLRQLDLEKSFRNVEGDEKKRYEREIISKALWGLFYFESIVGFVYLQLSLLPIPQIPRCFERLGDGSEGNRDVLGNSFSSSSPSPPFVPGVLDATCDLSLMLHKSMSRNAKSNDRAGSDENDTKARVELAKDVLSWGDSLPEHLKYEVNFTPQTGYIRVYVHEVVVSAFRPLHPDTVVWDSLTAKDVCLQFSDIDQDVMEQYFTEYSFRDYSCMALCGLYNTLLNVVFHLQDPNTHELFTRACRMVSLTARDYPMARFILQGMRALIWSRQMKIPPGAAPYLEHLGGTKDELRDVPVAFMLPDTDVMRDALHAREGERRPAGVEMGLLLSRWGALSVDD